MFSLFCKTVPHNFTSNLDCVKSRQDKYFFGRPVDYLLEISDRIGRVLLWRYLAHFGDGLFNLVLSGKAGGSLADWFRHVRRTDDWQVIYTPDNQFGDKKGAYMNAQKKGGIRA